jgi:rod shape-determining protein MreC
MPPYNTENGEEGTRREIVPALAFFLLAVVLIYLPPGAQRGVASTLRATVLRPFVLTQEGLARLRLRTAENEELRRRLDSLMTAAASRTDLVTENLRLRGLLSLSGRVGPSYRAATVVRPGTEGSESMFMIDLGSADGLRAPAAVVTREGLLGVVRDVRRSTSMALDWTHPDFRASAVTLDGAATGIVESHRGAFREEDRLVLNGTAYHLALEEGTVVVTSGLGGVYPRGIPVGRIRGIAEAEAGWRKSYWLEPLVEPGSVGHVLVATEAVGEAPPRDLSGAWPPDSIRTTGEMLRGEEVRADSLRNLTDSVIRLRNLLRGAGDPASGRESTGSVPPASPSGGESPA